MYSSESTTKDYVDANDLYDFLHNSYHDDVKRTEWVTLVNYFDSNSQTRLDFDDFLLILLPCKDKELRNVIKRSKYAVDKFYPDEKILHQDWEILLASLFKREIDLFRLKNNILEDLNSVTKCSPLELFQLIDTKNKSLIDHLTLKDFCFRNKYYATNDELIAMMRRVDTDGDSKINYNDFIQFITMDNPIK